MEHNDKLIETVEASLKAWNVISENEAFHDFLRRPYSEIKPILDKYFHEQREWLKPVDGVQSNRLFFHAMTLFAHADALYSIYSNDSNEIIKANSDLLRQDIATQFIEEFSPFIVALFKWDLDRRKWKNDSGKLSYLRRILQDLENELSGKREMLIKKYIWLVVDYFVHQMENGLALPDEAFDELHMKKSELAKARNMLKTISENVDINDFIDNEAEPAVSNIYTSMAKQFTDGLTKFTSRFDHLIGAFIQAQIEYKDLVAGILDSVNEKDLSEIKSALKAGNIPKFISLLQIIFASIPYNLIKKDSEAYYHVNIHVILKAIGCDIISEVSTNLGRIDSVVEFDDVVYIIEYKITNSDEALKQIIEKEYYQMYMGKGKIIKLVGVAFDREKRNIRGEFSYHEVKE